MRLSAPPSSKPCKLPVVLTVRRCQELSLTALHPHIRSYSPATTTPKCHTTSQCSQHLPVSLSGAANVIFPSFHSQHWQGHPSYLTPDALHPVPTVVSTCSKWFPVAFRRLAPPRPDLVAHPQFGLSHSSLSSCHSASCSLMRHLWAGTTCGIVFRSTGYCERSGRATA